MESKDDKRPVEQTTREDRPRIRIPHRQPDAEPHPERNRGSNRETIESVVIAFVLAFLFRTFEAEAFVIPTGSMAPTLMGRHKEVTCQECGQVFTVGETEGEDSKWGVCPNCRFENYIESNPAFKGDRILVLKALYDLPGVVPASLRDPKRWDVVVFKFPEEPQVNYIKRLVGLPGEELRIHYGNIYTRRDGDTEFQIARKSAAKQKVLRMLVHDNNHQSPTWREQGWPSRWQSDGREAWQAFDGGKSFESPAGLAESTEWSQLTYHHMVKPWGATDREKGQERSRHFRGDAAPPREQLISDFYSYNAGTHDDKQPHWVADLSLTLRADITTSRGKMRLELVQAGDRFICEFDLATGTCRLLRRALGAAQEEVLATAPSALMRPGRYSIGFGNTDNRLTVWLDDKLLFGDGFDYAGPGLGQRLKPTLADLQPARISVQGTHARLSDLVLYRDIYYTHGMSEYNSDFSSWHDVLSDPDEWEVLANARVRSFDKLGPDDFMMMGDNSPRSKDGRLWSSGADLWVNQVASENRQSHSEALAEIVQKPGGQVALADVHVVHRQLLIGRAFFVYWPHGVPFGPDWLQFDTPRLGPLGKFRLPFYPNVARMKMIE
jgi:signal peptidase I